MRHTYSISVLLVLLCVISIQAFTPATVTRFSTRVTPPASSHHTFTNKSTQLHLFKRLFKRNKNEKEETITTSVLKDEKGNVIETYKAVTPAAEQDAGTDRAETDAAAARTDRAERNWQRINTGLIKSSSWQNIVDTSKQQASSEMAV